MTRRKFSVTSPKYLFFLEKNEVLLPFLLSSYLRNRRKIVKLNNAYSGKTIIDWEQIKTAALHGSITNPLLIYINILSETMTPFSEV